MKILITGFEPFGGEIINPSYEAVKSLPGEVNGAAIIKRQVPTVFRKSIMELEKLVDEIRPDIVIAVGQAGGRVDISVERVAINIDDAAIKDNEGNQPVDEAIFEDGENAYFSNLPIKAIVKRIKEGGIPASISNSAGTFVCNHIMYGLLYLIDKKYPGIKGGFIHVPYLPEQVVNKRNTPSMNINDIRKALILAVEAIVEHSAGGIAGDEGKV
ncbi:MAG: pyroglutamyl-peptidase I [Clostridiaceae bacterium]|nr:pyroglutamyl-peptidase I [Clostridiaceae bacterium]